MKPSSHSTRLRSGVKRLQCVLGIFLLGGGILPSAADSPVHLSVFSAADGLSDSYAMSITWSPRGNVWVKHRDGDQISVMDGYSIQRLPSPGRDSYRIYESRTGQLWSLYPDGLAQYVAKGWDHHYVPEIRAEIQSHMLRRVRQIPLLPAEHNRVLFLLSDQLMEFVSGKRALVLKRVNETGLGRFIEMAEARDGGLWITGANGLAKVEGPLRQISNKSEWRIENLQESLGVVNLQRPFEGANGSMVTVATEEGEAGQRLLLEFDGVSWRKERAPGKNLLQAWPGWDGNPWAHTINALLRFEEGVPFEQSKDPTWMGQYRDVIVEPSGAFWLATSEGVARHAPYLWRSPRSADPDPSVVHTVFESGDGTVWFVLSDGLLSLRGDHFESVGWPAGFDPDSQTPAKMYELADGRLVITGGEQALLFRPNTARFEQVPHPEGRRIRILGARPDGTLWTQTSLGSPDAPNSHRLEQFDGDTFLPLELYPAIDRTRELDFVFTSRNGDQWFGSTGALTRIRNGQIETYGESEGFYGYQASCVMEIDDTRIWFAGGGRILQFDGAEWSVIRTGLDRVSRMIHSSSGKVWVAASDGIYAYFGGSWVSNGVEEGLPSQVATEVFEDRRGRLWVGTTRGLSLHQPEADLSPPETLSPEMDDSDGTSPQGTARFRLRAIDKWDYTRPERLLFSFRIDEGSWAAYTNTTTASFENLRAGKHRFEVRSMDRNWNQDIVTTFFDFSVVTPWHKEPRILVVLVSGLVLVLFFAGLAVNRHLQLIRSYAEVEKIVGIRTRELEKATAELVQSQKMRALGTLAAGISHDFNSILSIIKGSAQIIENHIDDKEKILTRVGRIKTMVDQGSGIVKSILGLSRVAEQGLGLCDLNALTEETLRVLGDEFLRGAQVRFEPAADLPRVRGVNEMIQQILLNLLINAVDAMPDGGDIQIRTSLTTRPPPNPALSPAEGSQYVCVTVRDSGCGIPEEIQQRIFEPFFTTKALSTRRGTGLGLSMVYELAKELQYGLHVDSQVGRGTAFTIVAPVADPLKGTS
ncbi:MAG: hypothetical protein K9N62_08130 [Verrucomicrobia bacterium]|nr:hypothetical protein [Verrucomicrobiota bacterium]